MTRAALVIFDDVAVPARILGMDWPEFRLREAVRTGARHIGVVATRVPRELVAAIDAVRSATISITLVRSASEAADLFHPEEAVFVLSGTAIVGRDTLAGLVETSLPVLLCLRGGAGDSAFELIDATHRWTGLAVVSGAQVRAAAANVGDWELASVLLRDSVRAGGQRVEIEREAIDQPTQADEAERAVRRAIASVELEARGWGEKWIISPISRASVGSLRRVLPSVARYGPAVVAIAALGAVVLSVCDFDAVALLLSLLSLVVAQTTVRTSDVTGIFGVGVGVPISVPLIGAASTLAAATLPLGADRASPTLALVLIGVLLMIARLTKLYPAPWLADPPGALLVLAVGAAISPVGLLVALIACVGHAFVSLVWLQNRLSGALTLPR